MFREIYRNHQSTLSIKASEMGRESTKKCPEGCMFFLHRWWWGSVKKKKVKEQEIKLLGDLGIYER